MTAAHVRPPGILSAGMTGGIACGRSTVGASFSRLGACVIDMDRVAHALLAPGGAGVAAVAAAFGDSYRDARGGIDRKRLGALVFHDAPARARLEAILHPMILAESERRILEFAREKGRGVAISDAALLVETGGYRRFDRLVVVVCDPGVQLQRLMARDGLAQDEARSRIAAQAPQEEKRKVADYVIDASGTLADTERRAHDVYGKLLEDLERLEEIRARRRP